MTLFVVLAALMAATGIALLAWPLLRRSAGEGAKPQFAPRASLVAAALMVAAAVLGLYPAASNYSWKTAERAVAAGPGSPEAMVARLEDRLRQAPQDIDGWLMLGRSYSALHRYYRAADAFEHVLDLTQGNNLDAVLGFGEALALADQSALNGRAGDLLEQAARLAPNDPRAMWWGGAVAYQRNELALARERWQRFLAGNPPPDIAQILKVKIGEIDQQIGPAAASAASPAGAAQPARVRVRIEVGNEAPPVEGVLFVLARHPGEQGPPLAVKRLPLGRWPLNVDLGPEDSMMPGRELRAGEEVQVVARVSRAGIATPSSGDRYGEVRYHVGQDGVVALRIDQKVP